MSNLPWPWRRLPVSGRGLVVVVAVVAVAAVSIGMLHRHFRSQLLRQATDGQLRLVESDLRRFEATLAAAERGIASYAARVSAIEPTAGEARQAIARFNRLVVQEPDGTWISRGDGSASGPEALIRIPAPVGVSEATRVFFGAALPISSQFGLGPSPLLIETTWVRPASGGELVFGLTRQELLRPGAADPDGPGPADQLSVPVVQPGGRPRWTPPRYDQGARAWLVSVVAPFRQSDNRTGVVGQDLRLRDLLSWLIPKDQRLGSAVTATPLYVVARDGRVLVQSRSAGDSSARLPRSLRRLLDAPAAGQQVFLREAGGEQMIVGLIPRLDARVVYRANPAALQGLVSRGMGDIQVAVNLLVVSLLLLLLLLVLLLLRRELDFQRRERRRPLEPDRDLEQLVQSRTQALEAANRELAQLAGEDPLTGVGNRRSFDQQLAMVWADCRRRREPLALVMVDVDHFKLYNDTYGHPAGDACLRSVVEVLRTALHRPSDGVYRYGGEEFALLLANTDARGARYCAERLRALMADRSLPHPLGIVTLSVGVASALPASDGSDDGEKRLLDAADAALYLAKQGGRDRVAGA